MKSRIVLLLFAALLFADIATAQVSYASYIKKYQEDYVANHEVVPNADKKHFHFFTPSVKYQVEALFTKLDDTTGFLMPTSGREPQRFFRYGNIRFSLNGKQLKLTIFRSKDLMNDPTYKNYLFLPFTDLTSGEDSYGGGRYIDLETTDIFNNKVIIDFNKAYNPYCAYASGYNCPIPPRENDLPVAVKAGEMNFGKKVH